MLQDYIDNITFGSITFVSITFGSVTFGSITFNYNVKVPVNVYKF